VSPTGPARNPPSIASARRTHDAALLLPHSRAGHRTRGGRGRGSHTGFGARAIDAARRWCRHADLLPPAPQRRCFRCAPALPSVDRSLLRAWEQLSTMWTGIRPSRYTLPPRRVVQPRRPHCGQQLVPCPRHRLVRACRTIDIKPDRRSGSRAAHPRPWPPPNGSRSTPPSWHSRRSGSLIVAGGEEYLTSGTPVCRDRRQLFSMPRDQSNQ